MLAGALLVSAAGSAAEGSSGNDSQARASGKRVDVVLRLAPRRSGIQKLARAVSDPASPRYGQYVSPKRIARRFGARRSSRRHVRSYLRRRGINSRVDVTRSFVEALVPARQARRLFGSSKGIRGRIPRGLRGRVRAVLREQAVQGQSLSSASAGTSGAAPELEPPHVRTGTPAGCAQGRDATFQPPGARLAGPAFTPNQIQTAYGASPLHAQGVTGEGVRAAVLGAGGFARSELKAFAGCFGIEVPPTRLVKVGTRSIGATSEEAALDLQMLTLMAPGLERLVVYDVGSGFFPVAFSSMLEKGNAPGGELPHVISVSQGECEGDLGRAQLRLTERVLAATAAAGITVAAGSGDNGAFCLSGREGFYPGSSRWVASVGGTSLTLEDSNAIADEVVWNDVSAGLLSAGDPASGGGGVSRYLSAPFYQRGLASWGDQRGYPDVAAMADVYPGMAIYCGSNAQGECDPASAANPFEAGFGTSAATPLATGLVALADQRRIDAGAPPLGFPNPLLYSLGERGGEGVLRDVVEGSNDLGRGCCRAGPGYDLASGWGSIDGEGLAASAGSAARR